MLNSKKLEAKHEKIIKELLRIGDNRRCVDCDSVGPQYIVSSFNVFVCTSCSGVHRQFGHRVKGISMCTFSADEVAALQAGGNEKFLATYCATWTPAALTRPVDRHPDRTKEWIETIYVTKRFFSDAPASMQPAEQASAPDTPASETVTTSNGVSASVASVDDGDVAVLSLEGLLGKDMPKLQVSIPRAPAAAAVSSSSVSVHSTPGSGAKPAASPATTSPQKAPTPTVAETQEKAAVVAPMLDLLGVDQLPATAPSAAEPWDPFAPPPPPPPPPPAVAVSHAQALMEPTPVSSKPASPLKSPMEQLAGFAVDAAPAAPAAESWSAFADDNDTHSSSGAGNGNTVGINEKKISEPVGETRASGSSSNLAKPATAETQSQQGGGWQAFGAGNASTTTSQAPAPNGVPPPVSSSQPPAMHAVEQHAQAVEQTKPPAPAAVVVDLRSEVPLDVFYPEFAKIRATGVLPTGQLVPGTLPPQYGMPSPSPPSQLAPSPYGQHPSSVSGFSPSGYIQSPTPTPTGGGSGQYHQYPPVGAAGWQHPSPQLHQQQYGAPSPAGSHAGQSWAMPSPPVAPPAAPTLQQSNVKLGTDPFAGLGSTFSGALPTISTNTSPSPGGYGTILPPQQQAPVAPQTAAASATLFGVNTSLTAYDLSAPAAPRAAPTGNPFA